MTVNEVAAVALNLTAVAPDRFSPVITTEVPTGPEVGANELIVGATLKLAALVPVPPAAVVAEIIPVVAPAGTVALPAWRW